MCVDSEKCEYMSAINTSVKTNLYSNIARISKGYCNENNCKSERSNAHICSNLIGFVTYVSTLDYQINWYVYLDLVGIPTC
jgi:hypothetical protein